MTPADLIARAEAAGDADAVATLRALVAAAERGAAVAAAERARRAAEVALAAAIATESATSAAWLALPWPMDRATQAAYIEAIDATVASRAALWRAQDRHALALDALLAGTP